MLELNYSLVLQIALFLALWAALKRLWFEPTMRVLKERAKRSEGEIAKARELEGEVERLRHEHHAALQHAKAEAQREVAEIMRRAEVEQKQLIAQANEDAQRTLAEVRARVAEDVAAARKTLSSEVGAIAREVTSRALGRAV
jgi:F-type H+-transporting ATPase subunit b